MEEDTESSTSDALDGDDDCEEACNEDVELGVASCLDCIF